MFTKTEQVWRHLVDGAHHGRRRWPSLTALATDLELPVSTVHRALDEPREIGAVLLAAGAPVRVMNPWKLLVLWAAKRDLKADIEHSFVVPASAIAVEATVANPGAVLGGCGAVVARLGGNTISDYSTVLVYGDPALPEGLYEEGKSCNVVVARADDRLAQYGRTTTLGQAWVDLFRHSGWQSAQFVHDLAPLMMREDQDALLPT